MEIVLFQVRTRSDVDHDAYERAFGQMLELVSTVPGFIGIDGFTAEDGSELAVARFDSPEAVAAWREHPEHVRTRERGRNEFFSAYDITVATVSREYAWPLTEPRPGHRSAAPSSTIEQ